MTGAKVFAAITLTILAVTGIAVWRYTFASEVGWQEVQNAAIRVDSGLKHESLIALRTRLADLDATLARYVRADDSRQQETRVTSIRQAIESVEWALGHEDGSQILDGSEEFSFYYKRPYLITEPTCIQSVGKLGLIDAEIASACLTYARTALTSPGQAPLLRTIDVARLRAKCSAAYEKSVEERQATAQAKRQGEARIEARRKATEETLRDRISQFVALCKEHFPLGDRKENWCWTDPNDLFFKYGSAPFGTREAALNDAIEKAKSGRVFKREMDTLRETNLLQSQR